MRRLSGQDAGFLNLELPTQPMTTLVLAILNPGTGARLTPEAVHGHMAAKIGRLPAFRWRVVPVPLGLSHPVFVEDAGFDLTRHIHHAELASPGGRVELDSFCARAAERRLDRRYPLWKLTLIDGLAGGRQALLLEIHHALMDGFATLATFSEIFSETGAAPPPEASSPQRVPGRLRLVGGALGAQARTVAGLPGLIRRTRAASAALAARKALSPVAVPAPGQDAPHSAINRGFSIPRRFARAELSLEQVKLVKDSVGDSAGQAGGVTVNDVALAVVAGALRHYLLVRDELPATPLVASVPVGMEGPGAPARTSGNRFSRITTSLATHVADPWERLQIISTVTRESKRRLELAGPELLPDWLEVIPPLVAGPAVRHGHRIREQGGPKARLDANVVVSNIRGPAAPWAFASLPVEDMYIAGPPNSGVGVTFVVWDYAGRLLIGILACADSVADPAELAEGLGSSLTELVDRAPARQT